MADATLPNIPRDTWRQHDNYPHNVLLLGSHENFRHISGLLVDAAWGHWSRQPKQPASPSVVDLFTRWKAAMRRHEAYEEHKLYPFLERHYNTDLDFLERQHRELGVLDARVREAFAGDDALAVATALRKHHECLMAHLDEEEEAVIPLLLALSRDEFVRYANGR